LDSIADGVFTVDKDWRITSFNRAAEKITGVSRNEALGQLCKDVLKADICERNCCLMSTMKTGEQIINKKVYIINAEGANYRSAFPRRSYAIKTESYWAQWKLSAISALRKIYAR